jgi:hypothetical protein
MQQLHSWEGQGCVGLAWMKQGAVLADPLLVAASRCTWLAVRMGERTLFYVCQAAVYWQQQCRPTACAAGVPSALAHCPGAFV